MHAADLPLDTDLISIYRFFTLTIWQNSIQIFFLKTCQNTGFFSSTKGFSSVLLVMQIFFLKILIFLIIYTDFGLDKSGRSEAVKESEIATRANFHESAHVIVFIKIIFDHWGVSIKLNFFSFPVTFCYFKHERLMR